MYDFQRERLPLPDSDRCKNQNTLAAPNDKEVLKWDLEHKVSLDDHPVCHLRRSLERYQVFVPP